MVADGGFGGRGEDDFGQLLGFLQAGGKGNAAYRAGLPVVFPAAAGQVAAHDGFHFDRGQFFGDDGAFFQCLRLVVRQYVVNGVAREVVGHDVGEFAEPEVGDGGEDFAFAGNGVVEDDVEGGEAVGCDHQHTFIVDFV